jgi:AcrR family transcriptional regulator
MEAATASEDHHEARETTRDRLLDAAERLFAQHGFEGASVRDITAAADCNVASVNYHFGGKDKLYLAVFQRRLAALREQRISSLERAMAEAGGRATLELVISTFTASFLEPLVADSQGRVLMELFSREMMSPHLPKKVFNEEMVQPVQEALARAMLAVCPELDQATTRLCILSLVAQLVYVIHARRFFAESGPVADLELQTFVDHINRFTVGGIRSLGREQSS